MSRKHFSWLLLATGIVAVLVLVFPGKTGRESSLVQTVLIPGLAGQVNDIEWFRLTAAGGEIIATLKRENNAWVVEETSSYHADWGMVKNLLSLLSRAEVIEEKTSKPGYYARLGVEDVSSSQAAGVMVEFSGDSGLAAVIIGNRAQGRDGQYARLRDSAESVLVDTRIDVPREQSSWLDKSIVDVTDAEVVEFEIIHPDGEFIKATRTSADDENFELQNPPADREINSEWTVNAPANSLAALDLQGVVPAALLDWESATRFRILTADGLMVEAELLVVPGGAGEGAQSEHWMRLNGGVYTTAVGSMADGEADKTATFARAEEINSRVNGWAYRIPGYRFDSMTRRMEDLLQPAGED